MKTSQSQDHQTIHHTDLLPSKRAGSRSAHDPGVRRGRKQRLHKPVVRSFANFGAKGRPSFMASANIDYSKPAFGSIPIDGGRFYWCAFRRLRDWLEGASPLDSGTSMSELKAHDLARALVTPYLRKREPLAPMPEAWVLAHHDRLTAARMAKEAAVRWLARVDDDGTIAGYDWEEVCQENEFDLIELALNPDGDDTVDIDATDEDEAKAA